MTTNDAATEARVVFENRVVPWGRIHPNPWNPNKMDEATYAAACESIQTFGFVDPLTVRDHPDIEGDVQIIDGFHRWKASGELLGHDVDLPTVVLLNLPDTSARKLTVILNESRGEADPILLGTLLAELSKELDPDELRVGLRFDDAELAHLMSLSDVDWDGFKPNEDEPQPPADDNWTTISCRVPNDVLPVWLEALKRVKDEADLHSDPAIEAGQALEILAAAYLAG